MLYWRAPNTEAGENTAYNNVRVGRPPTQRNWNTNFNRQCTSWRGPNTEKLEHQFLQAMQVGRDRNKFCENIIFVLLPLSFLFQSRDVKILRKNNATNQVCIVLMFECL